jgi:hypothetical protein
MRLCIAIALGMVAASSGDSSTKIVGLVHFANEALMLPYWIDQHLHIFDDVLFVDYNSTDSSQHVIASLAPPNWKYFRTSRQTFTSVDNDQEMMEFEELYPLSSWKLVLTVGEFIVSSNFRLAVHDAAVAAGSDCRLLRVPSLTLVGPDNEPQDPRRPLIEQRFHYGVDTAKPKVCYFV